MRVQSRREPNPDILPTNHGSVLFFFATAPDCRRQALRCRPCRSPCPTVCPTAVSIAPAGRKCGSRTRSPTMSPSCGPASWTGRRPPAWFRFSVGPQSSGPRSASSTSTPSAWRKRWPRTSTRTGVSGCAGGPTPHPPRCPKASNRGPTTRVRPSKGGRARRPGHRPRPRIRSRSKPRRGTPGWGSAGSCSSPPAAAATPSRRSAGRPTHRSRSCARSCAAGRNASAPRSWPCSAASCTSPSPGRRPMRTTPTSSPWSTC